MSRRRLLDASALLALLSHERGHEQIEELLTDAAISSVNFAEVATKLVEIGLDLEKVAERLAELDVPVLPFDSTLAFRAAALRRATRSHGLSLGDRACLATAAELGLPVVTADRIWARLNIGIDIHVIR